MDPQQEGRTPEQRYSPEPLDPRIDAATPARDIEMPREGDTHVKKFGQLAVLFSVMVFVFGFSFYTFNNQFTGNTRASITTGPDTLDPKEAAYTQSIEQYPVSYRDNQIPARLITEAELLYNTTPSVQRKQYIINRIVLYYIYSDMVRGSFTSPDSFTELEKEVMTLSSQAQQQEGVNLDQKVVGYLPFFSY